MNPNSAMTPWSVHAPCREIGSGGHLPMGRRARQGGFTFIEMMMVIVIVAILAGIAGPSMLDMIRTSKVRTVTSDFYAALLTARSEAIKRRTTTTLAPVGTTWVTGWTVSYGTSPAITVLQGDPIADVAVQVNVPAASTASITFGTNGRVSSTAPTVIFYSSLSTSVQARCVSVDAAGLPRVRTDTNSIATDGCQ